MKWRLTDLRLCQVLTLVAAGVVGVAKLSETRVQAHQELEAALMASATHACGVGTGRGGGDKCAVVMGAHQATSQQDHRRCRREGRRKSYSRFKPTSQQDHRRCRRK